MQDLSELKSKILKSIIETASSDDLESIRISSLGKKGSVTMLMKQLGKLQPQERKERGRGLNLLQTEINSVIEKQRKIFSLKGFEPLTL